MTLPVLTRASAPEAPPKPPLRPLYDATDRIQRSDLELFRKRVLEALHRTVDKAAPATRHFDSVVCFGDSDWWYHNRGHADMQFIRRFSRRCPVLYVNSLGMGAPAMSEGRMFLRRVLRKASSIGRYYRDGGEGFSVLSPIFLPVFEGRKGQWMARALALQLQGVMRSSGLRNPLLWIACPSAACVLDHIDKAGTVYQLSDCYAALNTRRADAARAMEAAVARRADLIVCSSRRLQEHALDRYHQGEYVDHGVDYDHFAAAAASSETPPELVGLRPPIVGFFGNIDGNTVDLRLLQEVIRSRPRYSFVFVGPMASEYEILRSFPNVTAIPKQPYHAVARYGAAFDVCLMPWLQSEWIEHCNPIKLKEYLSLGKPVVSTPFPELIGYAEFCYQARTPAEFAAAIDRAWQEDSPDRRQARRRFVARHTWDAKFGQVLDLLRERGIELESPPAERRRRTTLTPAHDSRFRSAQPAFGTHSGISINTKVRSHPPGTPTNGHNGRSHQITGSNGKVCLCGVRMDPLSMQNVMARVEQAVDTRTPLAISVVNVAKVVNMRHDELLRTSVESSDVILADGMPLVWLSRFRRHRLPQRIAGIDLMFRMFELADRKNLRMYLLGATRETLERVVSIARNRYPGAVIAGYHDGYFSADMERRVADGVREARADILLVAMSSPKKEIFMGRWGDWMNVAICHGVGGSFDVMAGKTRRAPVWMQQGGLEWFYRFLQEPGRMWKRYLKTNLTFACLAPRCLLCRDHGAACTRCPWQKHDVKRLGD